MRRSFENPSDSTNKNFNRRQKIMAGVAALTLASGLMAGCSGEKARTQEVPSSKPSATDRVLEEMPVHEPILEPKATPTKNTEAESSKENASWNSPKNIILREKPMPAALEKYKKMEINSFAGSLTTQKKYLYYSYLTQWRKQYMDNYTSFSGGKGFDKPVTITPKSTAIEILTDQVWQKRMATYMTKGNPEPQSDGTCGKIHKRMSLKYFFQEHLETV